MKKCMLALSCSSFGDPMDYSLPGSMGLFCKNTGVGCHFLLWNKIKALEIIFEYK